MLLKEIAQSVHEAIAKLINSGHWQRYDGPSVTNLQARIADQIHQCHVQVASSGTAALEIVLRAAGIGSGDEVLISAYDYPGNFWAIERVGARPVLVDTVMDSWRVDRNSLDKAFQPPCKALIASHLHGELQQADELKDWCDDRKILFIEDVCQAVGASWKDQPAGSFGHAAILSFGGGKLLSCGRGGAWATSDESLAIKARVASGAGSGPYSLSEIQAATILAQLPWLDQINAQCRSFFKELDDHLKAAGCQWTFVPSSALNSTAFYQCGWLLDKKTIKETTDETRQLLLASLRCGPASEQPDASTAELPFGPGFPGFHRRTSRRCRISHDLTQATSASERTLVLHHRVALELRWTPMQLANWIIACIAEKHRVADGSSGSS